MHSVYIGGKLVAQEGKILKPVAAHHDPQVAGDNDLDMVVAVEYLIGIGGGMALIKDGKVLASLPMHIGGLMSDRPGAEVAKALDTLDEVGQKEFSINTDMDAFTTLSFMALPVIPAYKLTDIGLFDVRSFSFVPMEL